MKPRPSSPPLTGSAVYVHDLIDDVDGEGEIVVIPSPRLQRKPKPCFICFIFSES
jgi:hypothetical protein